MKQIAVFVDAGYFWAQAGALLTGGHGPRRHVQVHFETLRQSLLQEASRQAPGADVLRVYWYDTLDATGKSAEHAAIDQLDDFKLRLSPRRAGTAAKGQNALMATDLLGLASQRAISHALVVSGDADLIAPVLTVQGMGLRVHLLTVGGTASTSPTLAAEADLKRSWSQDDVQVFAAKSRSFEPHADEDDDTQPPLPTSMEAIAQQAQIHIQASPHADALAKLLPDARSLPREVDMALLAAGRQQLGRSLPESEKRELRRAFRLRFQPPVDHEALVD